MCKVDCNFPLGEPLSGSSNSAVWRPRTCRSIGSASTNLICSGFGARMYLFIKIPHRQKSVSSRRARPRRPEYPAGQTRRQPPRFLPPWRREEAIPDVSGSCRQARHTTIRNCAFGRRARENSTGRRHETCPDRSSSLPCGPSTASSANRRVSARADR